MRTRKLVLRKETLSVLTNDELVQVVVGAGQAPTLPLRQCLSITCDCSITCNASACQC